MPYISGSVTISNTVTAKISSPVKTELIDTNARLEAIENELGRITSHLASIAETLQTMNKNRSEKPHRHLAGIS